MERIEPIKKLGGTGVQIEEKEFDFNDDIQKALLDTTCKSVKPLSHTDKVNFLDM